MKIGDKFVWVDESDSTADNEVLVYLGRKSIHHYFSLDGCGDDIWVTLVDGNELDWIKPLEGE